MNPMAEALKRKRAQGVDIEILVGGKPVAEMNVSPEGQTDKAPPMVGVVDEPGQEQEEQQPEALEHESAPDEMGEPDAAMEEQSPPEDFGGRKPRGLGERAKMMNASRLKKA